MKFKMTSPWYLIILFMLLKLTIHFLTNTNYELQRDAYLYLAMGYHPDLGYMSVPPSIAFLGAFMRLIFGDSVFAVRLAPALAGAFSVMLVGMFVRELGGKSWAIVIGCMAFITSPAFLRSNTLFQPVTFNQFYWLLSAYFLLRLINKQEPRYWLIIFSLWGLAFLNKYSIVFFAFSVVLAFMIIQKRELILNKYFAAGTAIGFLIVLPNLIWQYAHNWPVVHHMLDLQASQLVHVRIIDFLYMQILMNFPQVFIWLPGLIYFAFLKEKGTGRLFAVAYLILIATFLILRGKAYYTLGIYPVFFAGGAVAIELWSRRAAILKYLAVPVMVLLLLPILPFGLPVLKPGPMVVYDESVESIGFGEVLRWEDGQIHSLPQDYADMIAWEELAGIVINTYQQLSPEEQPQTCIFTENYGEAGAIKYFGKKYHLPEPVSFNDSFIFWAPDTVRLNNLIYVNDDTSDVNYFFTEVTRVGQITNPYARESGLPVFLCRGPRNQFEEFYHRKVTELKAVYRRD
jgi:hypothetical protein